MSSNPFLPFIGAAASALGGALSGGLGRRTTGTSSVTFDPQTAAFRNYLFGVLQQRLNQPLALDPGLLSQSLGGLNEAFRSSLGSLQDVFSSRGLGRSGLFGGDVSNLEMGRLSSIGRLYGQLSGTADDRLRANIQQAIELASPTGQTSTTTTSGGFGGALGAGLSDLGTTLGIISALGKMLPKGAAAGQGLDAINELNIGNLMSSLAGGGGLGSVGPLLSSMVGPGTQGSVGAILGAMTGAAPVGALAGASSAAAPGATGGSLADLISSLYGGTPDVGGLSAGTAAGVGGSLAATLAMIGVPAFLIPYAISKIGQKHTGASVQQFNQQWAPSWVKNFQDLVSSQLESARQGSYSPEQVWTFIKGAYDNLVSSAQKNFKDIPGWKQFQQMLQSVLAAAAQQLGQMGSSSAASFAGA